MANGRSCCCAGLSKGWWWLLTLLGLPFLYFLMLSAKWDSIEKDIQSRTQEKLLSSNADWSTVEIEKRGRDVLLIGTAVSEEARYKAIETALNVEGVRIVEDGITVKALILPSLQALFDNEKYILEGTLSSQKEIDILVATLAEKVSLDNIINKLTIGDGYANTGGVMILSGMVMSQDSLDTGSEAFKASAAALGLTLSGNLSLDIEAIAALAKQAEEKEAALAQKAEEDAAAKKAEEEAALAQKAEEDAATKKAEEEAALAQKAEEDAATKKAEEEAALAQKAEEDAATKKAEEEAALAQKAEEDRLARMIAAKTEVDACQAKLTNSMVEKTILFETNKANIKSSSFHLLKNITSVISECRSKVPDSRISIAGHTDSRGSNAYNLALSQRRADAVKQHLISAGVDTLIITSTGFGETQPVASNNTVEGQTQNRRITFSVR